MSGRRQARLLKLQPSKSQDLRSHVGAGRLSDVHIRNVGTLISEKPGTQHSHHFPYIGVRYDQPREGAIAL